MYILKEVTEMPALGRESKTVTVVLFLRAVKFLLGAYAVRFVLCTENSVVQSRSRDLSYWREIL